MVETIVRTPILRQFCQCNDISVMAIDGRPVLAPLDHLSAQEIDEYLKTATVFTAAYLMYLDEDKLEVLAKYGIPVYAGVTKGDVGHLIPHLSQVEGSEVWFSIGVSNDIVRELYTPKFPSPLTLRGAMDAFKSHKIPITAALPYNPGLMRRVDLYETIEMIRNYVSHLVIQFHDVGDDELQRSKTHWETAVPHSIDRFKKAYEADVPNRSWKVKPRFKRELIAAIKDFVGKTMTVSVGGAHWSSPGRIRYVPDEVGDFVWGSKVPLLKRKGSVFVRDKNITEPPCEHCGLTTFL